MEVKKFCLHGVRGPVHSTQKVTIGNPFSTVSVHANASVKGHYIQVYVFMELTPGPQLPTAVVPTVTYEKLHPGSSRMPICLCNLTTHTMEIPTKTLVRHVVPANQVPTVVHPARTSKEMHNKSHKGWILEALDLQGLKEWPESEQKQARELLLKWEHLFLHSNLDLAKLL